MQTPYRDELRKRTVQKENGNWKNKQVNERHLRRSLVDEYAWAIPDNTIITRLAEYGSVIEIGAGSGYWSWLIERAGGNPTPVDPSPGSDTWTDVTRDDHTFLTNTECSTMLLCWPPFSADWTSQAVDLFEGDRLVYVGEPPSGVTGSAEFHRSLREDFGLAKDVIDIPSWEGVNDRAYVFTR